jgi:hypothetical protein
VGHRAGLGVWRRENLFLCVGIRTPECPTFSGSLFRLRFSGSTHCACDRNKSVLRLFFYRCRQHLMSTKAGVINNRGFFCGVTTELVPKPLQLLKFLDHTHTHTQKDCSERVVSSSQRPLPTQRTQDEYPCFQRDSKKRFQQSS